ncbi:DNA/RNA non-specific endonuclease [Methylovulum psychrotolerans]|uniref:DNA/RNA non-specific endonuclease n=2 Tax=Methylovulum psychrotolerans TaxID=1704499 RepID=A0A2S5CIR4_9GAMM|nr:DNA/RNA non-specific endonuclease [Methylovulum psychrotolerans]
MAPSADMPDQQSQAESFSLANMAPQLHANNAGIWEELENGVRNLALSGHDVYVVSGPLFEGAALKQIKNRVMVPTAFFKAFYDATSQQAGAYITPNAEGDVFAAVSLDVLAKRAGVEVFPGLAPALKSAMPEIVMPARRTHCPGRKK